MSENNRLPVVTQEIVKAKLNISLTQQGISIQKIQDEINALEHTEENMPKMQELIGKLKDAGKAIEARFKEGKGPYLEGGKTWDTAKNSMLSINEDLLKQVIDPYNKLCAAVEKRQKDAENEKRRIDTIKTGIENNVISFSSQIAQCDTNDQLLAIERVINLEKSESRKVKYGEFHDLATERYNTILLPILKDQKEKIKAKESIEKKIKDAEDGNDAAKIDELTEEKEKIDNEIRQNQVNIQQDALNLPVAFDLPVAEEVYPTIRTVNRISFEIVDVNVAVKKCPELLDISVKTRDAQKVAMTLKEAGTFKDKDEVTVNGIRFFIDKSYK